MTTQAGITYEKAELLTDLNFAAFSAIDAACCVASARQSYKESVGRLTDRCLVDSIFNPVLQRATML